MRIFDRGNWPKGEPEVVCPICKTQKKGKVTLVAIDGTEEGFNVQAMQVHVDCLELHIMTDKGIIYQKVP